jgi:D-lactate dehydrogenase (cytochrome)
MTKKDLNLLDLTHAPGIIGHVGDGNFHVGIIYNPLDPVEKESVKMVVNGMIDNAIEIEGTCTV